ncbi:Membrane protein involved in the export of O-antigen and teichoic acid [Bradyrhizobium lablabi]|uniref:Membrane protein involved in the export of O-antigen and teichoic acid n=1 Tax=Bradyrhizobium lablabi TaxID=722472 RepID=A0A1M6MPW9_9BRAD|nr:oligosaccharide flippase family protein [Bradyrhizobium lablabi]SHJ85521.1 Membrane protein involved in the export of O-antigen and teichoic acid [Bradyrhizobium lablabi]
MQIAATLNRFGRQIVEVSLRRQFFRNVAVVLTGAALAQLITVALSPVISRLFSPAAFGALGTFMALLGLIGPIATLTYSAAIVLPKHDEESAAVVWLSLLISAVVSIISLVAIVLFDTYSTGNWLESVQSLLYLVPLVIVFEAVFQVAQQCMIRERRYRQTAQISIIQAAVSSAAKIGAGIFSPSSFSLVLVSLLAVPINAVLLGLALNSNSSRSWWPAPAPLKAISATAIRYLDFPLYRAPQSLISAVSLSLPLLILAYFHGPAAAGFFTLSNSVLGSPTQLLTKAINDVFFPRLVDASHKGEQTKLLILKAAGALGAVSIIPLGAVALAGPFLFQLVFGARWLEAGEYSQWLSLLTFTTLVLRSGLSAVPILNMQGTYLIFEIASTILKLGSLSITLFADLPPIVPIALFAITGSVTNALFFWYVIIKSEQFDKGNSHVAIAQ